MDDRRSIVVTVDVEEWFHILDVRSSPDMSRWDHMERRVEGNFLRLLDTVAKRNARITCFFLGWIAERYPHLVEEASARGHEIASHGFSHELIYRLTPAQFLDDTLKARALLQDISGQPVHGYRAPGFSATAGVPWFFNALMRAGHQYDASIFPARRGHGGSPHFARGPQRFHHQGSSLTVFPASVAQLGSWRVCFFGGGYFRLFPYALIKKMTNRVLDEGLPVIFYIHPRDIDPDQPRIPMPWRRRFKSYVGLSGTLSKLGNLLTDFRGISFQQLRKNLAVSAGSQLSLSRGTRPVLSGMGLHKVS